MIKECFLIDGELTSEAARLHYKMLDKEEQDKDVQPWNAMLELITSLQRVCKHKRNELENDILDNFAKYAELVDSSISKSIWRKMILGQHHGLPTRLLDWSKSPLIALNFAMTEGNMDDLDKRDCVVWRIDVNKLHQHLPEKYSRICKEKNQNLFTVDMIAEVCDSLDQANVNERIVYPGLDGIAQWVSRHFYVRNTDRLRVEKLSLPKLDADVIVNSTNTSFDLDGRVSKAVVKYAGSELEKSCNEIAEIELGQYAVTKGFGLKADVVLHACAPDWEIDQRTKNDPLLIKTYTNCLQYVVDNNYGFFIKNS